MPAAAYPDAPRQWNHSRSLWPWQAARASTRKNFYAIRGLSRGRNNSRFLRRGRTPGGLAPLLTADVAE